MFNQSRAPFSVEVETRNMNPTEYGIYVMLMDACLSRGQFPTFEQAKEWAAIETKDELESMRGILDTYFVKTRDIYVHERIKNYLEDREKCDQ